MARTKQTARKSTGGKAPRKVYDASMTSDPVEPFNSESPVTVGGRTLHVARQSTGGKAPRISTQPTEPFSNITNTYNAHSSFSSSECPGSPARGTLDSFNPFSHAASPVKSLAAFNSYDDEDQGTSANSFQFATSVADFLNPGQDVEEASYYPYSSSYGVPSHSYSTQVAEPYSSHSYVASSQPDERVHELDLPARGSINMGNFFTTNAGRAFRTLAAKPVNPMSELQLLVYKLRRENHINSEERGILKDAILRGELQDVLDNYNATNNKEQLIAEFKRFCGSSSSSAPSSSSLFGTSVYSAVPASLVSNAPRDASPSAAKSLTSKMLLLVAKLSNMGELNATEKSTIKDKIIRAEGKDVWESALQSFERSKNYTALAAELKQMCHGGSVRAASSAGSSRTKTTSEMLMLVAKLFAMQKISATERSELKDRIVKGNTSELEAAIRSFESNNDYDSLAEAFKRVVSPQDTFGSSFGSFSSFSEPATTQQSAWLDKSYAHSWTNIGDNNAVLFLDSPLASVPKIACFDLDDTLVRTKSGKKFATAANDFVPLFPEVRDKLRQLVNEGYKLVIFSNQLGVGSGKMPAQYVTGRINAFSKEMGVPIQAFCALQEDLFRKPATKMWDLLIQRNGPVDLDQSFYVGDAAGRPADGIHPKDFSCSDRKFASNVGIKFYTPEEFFLGEAPRSFSWDSADLSSATKAKVAFEGGMPLISSQQELVIFVGFPASGKSTFAKKHFVPAGYVHVNRDTLKTPSRCLQLTTESLAAGKSVVVDNTNPSSSTRKEYIDLAKARGIPVRCFRFLTEESFSNHLNIYREKKEGVKHVPKIAYAMFRKQFEEPRKEEGFVEIKEISFVPDFENQDDERMFYQHT